jgi:hypothetical protein
MLPSLHRFTTVTESGRLLLRSSELQRTRQHPPKDIEVSALTIRPLIDSSAYVRGGILKRRMREGLIKKR